MANLYDVNFNVYTSITIEANSREEAEEEFFSLTNGELIQRLSQSVTEGGVDVGTIELLEGEEPEYSEDGGDDD